MFYLQSAHALFIAAIYSVFISAESEIYICILGDYIIGNSSYDFVKDKRKCTLTAQLLNPRLSHALLGETEQSIFKL